MNRLLPLLFVVLSTQLFAHDSDKSHCTLDVSRYEAKAKALANAKPGASLNPETFEVTWIEREFGRVSVEIIGCDHLGLTAKMERGYDKTLNHKQVIALAKKLITMAWPVFHSRSISSALDKLERIETDASQNSYASFAIDGYDSVIIKYSFNRGVMRIEVSAIQTV